MKEYIKKNVKKKKSIKENMERRNIMYEKIGRK